MIAELVSLMLVSGFSSEVHDWSIKYHTIDTPKYREYALKTANSFDFVSIDVKVWNAIDRASFIFEGDSGHSRDQIRRLLLFTGAVESHYIHLRNLDGGEAVSFWQVQPTTAVDLWINARVFFGKKFEREFAHYLPTLNQIVKNDAKTRAVVSNLILNDVNLAAAFAAAVYVRNR